MSKKLYYLLLLLTAVIISGCRIQESQGTLENADAEMIVPETSTEQIIEAWIEDSREIFLAQSRVENGIRYILVTYGEKESDGYNLEITAVEEMEEYISVQVTFTRPGEAIVNDIITYPYALAEIPAGNLPVRFFAAGDENSIPILEGLEYIPTVAASSSDVVLFSPAPDSSVGKEFTVEGIARLDNCDLIYQVTDDSHRVLIKGVNTVSSPNWRFFRLDVALANIIPAADIIYLNLFTGNVSLPADTGVKIPLLLADQTD